MLEYLQKFKALPQELRDAVSGEVAVKQINDLEAKYSVSLADIIIRLMVRDIALSALPGVLVMEQKMELGKADELFNELKNGLLLGVSAYLNGNAQVVAASVQAKEINTVTPVQQLSNSPFYFDVEDEEEVRQHAVKLEDNHEQVNQDKANEIIGKLQLSFGSEVLLDRLRNIIATYLSGVRNRLDTKLVFNKSIEQGGVNLDELTIDRIFKMADDMKCGSALTGMGSPQNAVKSDILKCDIPGLDRLKEVGARDFEYDLGALEQNSKRAKEQDTQEVPKTLGRPRQEKESFNVSDSDPFAYRRPKEAVGKVVMSDVKVSLPKVMGPIDELHYLDLIVFRRLAKAPEDAILKIKDKLDLLEAEMFSKKLEGIKAWRLSPLYLEYLKVAEQAIKSGRSVTEIINEQLAQKPNGITQGEFESIMKLNRELRF